MRGLSLSSRNTMLAALVAQAHFIGIHSAAPGGTGANELSGAGPDGPYTRAAVTFGAPSGAESVSSGAVGPIQIPIGSDACFWSAWNLVSGGTFLGAWPLQDQMAARRYPSLFTADGGSEILTSEDHGFINGQTVVVRGTNPADLPLGLLEETPYYVRDATTDTFRLAVTAAGTAINLADDGAGYVTNIDCRHFASLGRLTLATLRLSLCDDCEEVAIQQENLFFILTEGGGKILQEQAA